MFRALTRQLSFHRQALNAQGWYALTRAAFSLYLDSRERQLPLRLDDQHADNVVPADLDRTGAPAAPLRSDVCERAALVEKNLER